MKKVLFIIDELSNGGAERVVSIIANKMIDYEIEVSILMLHGNRNDYHIDSRINLLSFEKTEYRNIFHKHLSRIKKIRQSINSLNPEIVISFDVFNNIYTILASLFTKNMVIISERNDPNQYPKSKAIQKVRNLLYNLSDKIVFQTPDAMNYFNKGIRSKGEIIFNPISEGLPRWKPSKSDKYIISATRLTEQKNIPMLIDAFNLAQDKLGDIKLKIYGRGPLEDYLNQYIRSLNLENKVTLNGYSEKVHNLMANSHAFIISSNYEGISNSMLEAMSIGVPVISTDSPIGGARMMIENNKNGILVNVGDVEALSEAMIKLVNNPDFSRAISEKALKINEKLDATAITDQWIKLLN